MIAEFCSDFTIFAHGFYSFQGSAKDIWTEVSHLKTIPNEPARNRTARQGGYGPGPDRPVINPLPNVAGSCDGNFSIQCVYKIKSNVFNGYNWCFTCYSMKIF